jgi:hypothetical protein
MARQRKKNGSTVGSAEASGTTPLADCDHDEWLECELTAWKTLFAEPLKGIREGERGREELTRHDKRASSRLGRQHVPTRSRAPYTTSYSIKLHAMPVQGFQSVLRSFNSPL